MVYTPELLSSDMFPQLLMKPRRILKISLTDEARLQTLASLTLTPAKTVAVILAILLGVLLIGYLFVLLTPVKTLIPGYFRASQRAASEEALLRVDSIREAYLRNEAYVANLHEILNTDRKPRIADAIPVSSPAIVADSLLPPSRQETSFVQMMQEREKFNISVVAPMAAEGMLFYPVTDEGIVSNASRDSRQAHVILPAGASIMAVADGIVIACFTESGVGRYTLLLQHDNGFVSRYSHLGSPLVEESETILGGQVLSLPPGGKAGQANDVIIELWHNGIPLKPYDYISSPHSYTSLQP